MTSFKQFLKEDAGRYTSINDDLADFIKAHCSDAIWMFGDKTPIWRGTESHHQKPAVIDPTTSERQSANTTNHYTVLLDNNPFMKNFPKRSRSLIASTSKSYAGGYGELYAIIPFNNVPIGFVGLNDIWNVRIKFFGETLNFEEISSVLRRMLQATIENFKDFDMRLKNNDRMALSLFNRAFTLATEEQRKNFLDTLYDALSPENTGFLSITTKDQSLLQSNRKSEVWIGGKCVMIPLQQWETLTANTDFYKKLRGFGQNDNF